MASLNSTVDFESLNSTLKTSSLQSKSNIMEATMFTNLLLLGIDAVEISKKYGIPIGPDMFKSANVKGMEVIFHFLFSCIDPKKAKEV
jgi:hypothetical protein